MTTNTTTPPLLVPKFEYKPLSRVNINGKRHYNTPDGLKLPSVTTILDRTKSEEDKAGLQAWRDWVGHAKAQQITTEAAGTGTAMHKMLEDYCLGKAKPPGTNMVQKIAYPMAQEVIKHGLSNMTEIWGSELPLYFPSIYAGSCDGAGVWKNKEAIYDFKQTNKPKTRARVEDYYYQLLMYATAHNEIHGTNIRTGVIMMCSRACEYQEFVVEGAEWDEYEQKMWKRIELYYKNV